MPPAPPHGRAFTDTQPRRHAPLAAHICAAWRPGAENALPHEAHRARLADVIPQPPPPRPSLLKGSPPSVDQECPQDKGVEAGKRGAAGRGAQWKSTPPILLTPMFISQNDQCDPAII